MRAVSEGGEFRKREGKAGAKVWGGRKGDPCEELTVTGVGQGERRGLTAGMELQASLTDHAEEFRLCS